MSTQISKVPNGTEFALSLPPRLISALRTKEGKNCRFFLCFGLLLGLVRDGGLIKEKSGQIKDNEDVDFGVLYEEGNCGENARKIEQGFQAFAYRLKKRVINDVSRETLYLSFSSLQKGRPDICIYFWYLHKGIRYHTYDILHENKEIPATYTFKGVPADCFTEIIQICPPCLNRPTWIPLKYGTLLDLWYPQWIFPQATQSVTPYMVNIQSCRDWSKI